ncbi:hypothetical protein X773_26785 [Mesorhizobium sp. LSJC285A00]|nr:hypothetical protein X773_26785 [Mesorhizobium sp. LSJC285A00]
MIRLTHNLRRLKTATDEQEFAIPRIFISTLASAASFTSIYHSPFSSLAMPIGLARHLSAPQRLDFKSLVAKPAGRYGRQASLEITSGEALLIC